MSFFLDDILRAFGTGATTPVQDDAAFGRPGTPMDQFVGEFNAQQPGGGDAYRDLLGNFGFQFGDDGGGYEGLLGGGYSGAFGGDDYGSLVGRSYLSPRSAPGNTTGGAFAPPAGTDLASPAVGGRVAAAIDAATDDPRIRQAMKLAVLLEGGNFEGGWGVGDQGQSFGPYQIYTAVHRVTREQAEDPVFATKYMLPEFQKAVAAVPASLWQTDPMRAAMLTAGHAERPAMWGQDRNNPYPIDRVRAAWARMQSSQQQRPATTSSSGALQAATSAIGVPYVWGGGTKQGFDCSGLTQWSYAQSGKQIPRTAQQQYNGAARVDLRQLQPGDLVFYENTYKSNERITHVAIYAGNGQVIMAPTEGQRVKYVALNDAYWGKHLVSGGRY